MPPTKPCFSSVVWFRSDPRSVIHHFNRERVQFSQV